MFVGAVGDTSGSSFGEAERVEGKMIELYSSGKKLCWLAERQSDGNPTSGSQR